MASEFKLVYHFDLERLGDSLSRHHVCGLDHDRGNRLSVQPDPERVGALDHSVEGGALGHLRRGNVSRYQSGADLCHAGCPRTT